MVEQLVGSCTVSPIYSMSCLLESVSLSLGKTPPDQFSFLSPVLCLHGFICLLFVAGLQIKYVLDPNCTLLRVNEREQPDLKPQKVGASVAEVNSGWRKIEPRTTATGFSANAANISLEVLCLKYHPILRIGHTGIGFSFTAKAFSANSTILFRTF